MKAIADTSLLIGKLDYSKVPDQLAISVMTLSELTIGVLTAKDSAIRSQRMKTLSKVEEQMSALPVDKEVSRCFAELVAEAKEHGRKPKVIDALIAATAMSNNLPVYTRDSDFAKFDRVECVLIS